MQARLGSMAERIAGTARARLDPLLRRAGHLFALDLEALSLPAGIRAALACALPVLLAEITGRQSLTWIAITAFWGCLVDTGGAWRTRLAAMTSFTLFAALACFISVLVRPTLGLSVAFAFVWIFGASLIRVYGNAAATTGTLLTTAVLVTL